MKGSFLLPALLLAMVFQPCVAEEEAPLADENARINYSVGYQVGSDFQRPGMQLDPEIVARGVEDAMSGADPLLSPLEMRKELGDLQRRARAAKPASKPAAGAQ